MSTYSKMALRAVILIALVVGCITLSRPRPVLAAESCTQICAKAYQVCVQGCFGHNNTPACKSNCETNLEACMAGC